MGTISIIVLAFFCAILGLTWVAAITASIHLLGVFLIILAVVLLLDNFWLYGHHYGPR